LIAKLGLYIVIGKLTISNYIGCLLWLHIRLYRVLLLTCYCSLSLTDSILSEVIKCIENIKWVAVITCFQLKFSSSGKFMLSNFSSSRVRCCSSRSSCYKTCLIYNRTTANKSSQTNLEEHSKVHIGYNGTRQIHPKTAPSLRRSPPLSNTPIPNPTPLTISNLASEFNQPFCHSKLSGQTDRQTDRPTTSPCGRFVTPTYQITCTTDAKSHVYNICLVELLIRSNRGVEYCAQRVCPSVCLSAGVSREPHVWTSRNFLYVSTASVDQSCSCSATIRHIFPVI